MEHHLFQNAAMGGEFRNLRQVGDAHTAGADHIPAVGLLCASQNAQERGFSRAVDANDPDFVALIEEERHIVEDFALHVCFGNILCG